MKECKHGKYVILDDGCETCGAGYEEIWESFLKYTDKLEEEYCTKCDYRKKLTGIEQCIVSCSQNVMKSMYDPGLEESKFVGLMGQLKDKK